LQLFSSSYAFLLFTYFQFNCFYVAATHDADWAIKILLENGADRHIKDKEGELAVKYAEVQNFHRCVKLLEDEQELEL